MGSKINGEPIPRGRQMAGRYIALQILHSAVTQKYLRMLQSYKKQDIDCFRKKENKEKPKKRKK